MARLTRNFLKSMNIEDENVQEQIIEAHMEAVNSLKAQRDEFKEAAEKLPKVQDDLTKAQEELEQLKSGENPYKQKYEDTLTELNTFKSEVEKEKVLNTKKSAFIKVLKEIPIADTAIDGIVRVTNFDEMELDGENLKDVDKVKADTETQWNGFKVTSTVEGATTPTPPTNTGGSFKSKDEILSIKDPVERQKAIAGNMDLFKTI